jgi:hypothetical protein
MAAFAIGPKSVRQSAMLRSSLSYAARGVPVFLCEPPSTRPLTKGGFWDTITDERQIRAWWGRWPKANVGVPTGTASGLLVLDVDRSDGLESIVELELALGQAPNTLRARTGRGGEHLFFRMGENREVRNSQGFLGPGLDIRGEGGYMLVAPAGPSGPTRGPTAPGQPGPPGSRVPRGAREARARQEAVLGRPRIPGFGGNPR